MAGYGGSDVNITEVRIKLMESSEDRLRAFCSITIDDSFVVRDLKIIDGSNGPFVAMPSRKLAGHCPSCGYKNHLRARFCNQCGARVELDADFADSPQKLYADVAHPINSECREMIQNAVIDEFEAELDRSDQPGYRSRYDDDFGYEESHDSPISASDNASSTPQQQAMIDPPDNSGPGRPKFADRPDSQSAQTAGGRRPDDSGFGAGIFD